METGDVLVLLPSCSDVSRHPRCIYCKAHALIQNPELYDVEPSVLRAAQNFVCQNEELDKKTFARIMELTEVDHSGFEPARKG